MPDDATISFNGDRLGGFLNFIRKQSRFEKVYVIGGRGGDGSLDSK